MARPAIVFIGFMGAGKSTALAAARRAGLGTTEIDDLMERELGMPIAAAFERIGEAGFRERESEVVGSLLEEADGSAIAWLYDHGQVLERRDEEDHAYLRVRLDPADVSRFGRIADGRS